MSTGTSWICIPHGLDHAVLELGEFRSEFKIVEELQGAGVHGVAAEVGALLHHDDVDPAAGEQYAQHHARGTTASDQARRGIGGASHRLIVGWVR
jgi:hypothetical protein